MKFSQDFQQIVANGLPDFCRDKQPEGWLVGGFERNNAARADLLHKQRVARLMFQPGFGNHGFG